MSYFAHDDTACDVGRRKRCVHLVGCERLRGCDISAQFGIKAILERDNFSPLLASSQWFIDLPGSRPASCFRKIIEHASSFQRLVNAALKSISELRNRRAPGSLLRSKENLNVEDRSGRGE